jgi:LPXTG-motif cell wall-anchored protein
MVGIIIGVILLGLGGFFSAKKNKKIGLPCLIIGAVVFGISMVVAGVV